MLRTCPIGRASLDRPPQSRGGAAVLAVFIAFPPCGSTDRRRAGEKQTTGTEAQIRLMPPGEANMEVIIAIGWIVGIWVVVLAFSVYFSQNLK